MSSCRKALLTLALMAVAGLVSAQGTGKYPGVGRNATPKEVAAWDIDVRPDFKGLPVGAGTVAKGQDVWEAKCAQCHGVFGESNEVFNPLIGGTTADDVKTGRVAKLMDPAGGRTTFMKVASLSTVWDYINRAMPWTAPKSLTTDEVYSVTAFLLNLAGIVPDNFTLSNKNMGEVQARLPNRNGMQTKHAMWPGDEFGGTKKADTANVACMKNCSTEPTVASFLPDFARDAHGNLLEQNRIVGPQRGADTSKPEGKAGAPGAATSAPVVVAQAATDTKTGTKADGAGTDGKAALALATKNGCTVCHGVSNKIVGPAFSDVAKKHAGKADYLAGKIKSGGSGLWGPIPMPPQTLSDADAKTIAAWLASGAAK
jgi:S-disulfanyl-L-cysteine oxidoreductase SoxD